LAKIDKSQYTKQQWRVVKEERRRQKELARQPKLSQFDAVPQSPIKKQNNQLAFVLGNGTSRKSVDVEKISKIGKIYGCNALYRTFAPDYLVAVDVKMILEITKTGYQKKHTVWSNPNKAYGGIPNLNLFQPSKGWSSGPTALWLAAQHSYEKIYILGFDYKGIENKFNNMYADTANYKKSQDSATFFGNWLRQTKNVIQENPNIQFIRVITADNYQPEELNKFSNFTTILLEDFKKIYQLS
jgi:hypothetical protein|tara:strand:+ start:18543 stop:19268 length:726 start_codon:yes stop_codon:yes gene_type:complete